MFIKEIYNVLLTMGRGRKGLVTQSLKKGKMRYTNNISKVYDSDQKDKSDESVDITHSFIVYLQSLDPRWLGQNLTG